MATLSPALQAKMALLKAAKLSKETQQLDKGTAESKVDTQAVSTAVSTEVTKPSVPTGVPNSQPAVMKPSLVTVEGAGEYEPFKIKLAELEDQLENQVPGFAFTLRDIHRTMAQDANVVTVLSEAEISIIVKGLARHMDTTVVVAKKGSTKRTQPVNADDL